jgi:hypothetical protein
MDYVAPTYKSDSDHSHRPRWISRIISGRAVHMTSERRWNTLQLNRTASSWHLVHGLHLIVALGIWWRRVIRLWLQGLD